MEKEKKPAEKTPSNRNNNNNNNSNNNREVNNARDGNNVSYQSNNNAGLKLSDGDGPLSSSHNIAGKHVPPSSESSPDRPLRGEWRRLPDGDGNGWVPEEAVESLPNIQPLYTSSAHNADNSSPNAETSRDGESSSADEAVQAPKENFLRSNKKEKHRLDSPLIGSLNVTPQDDEDTSRKDFERYCQENRIRGDFLTESAVAVDNVLKYSTDIFLSSNEGGKDNKCHAISGGTGTASKVDAQVPNNDQEGEKVDPKDDETKKSDQPIPSITHKTTSCRSIMIRGIKISLLCIISLLAMAYVLSITGFPTIALQREYKVLRVPLNATIIILTDDWPIPNSDKENLTAEWSRMSLKDVSPRDPFTEYLSQSEATIAPKIISETINDVIRDGPTKYSQAPKSPMNEDYTNGKNIHAMDSYSYFSNEIWGMAAIAGVVVVSGVICAYK